WKRRQNFGRLLRGFWLDERLPRMCRMQRLGKNGLPRMESIGAETRCRFKWLFSGRSSGSAECWKDRRKILHRTIPGDFRPGRCDNRALRLNIPDGRGEKDQERLKHNCTCECVLGESLFDPAIAKVWTTEEFLRRCRASDKRNQAGEELLERSRPLHCQPRASLLFGRFGNNGQILRET